MSSERSGALIVIVVLLAVLAGCSSSAPAGAGDDADNALKAGGASADGGDGDRAGGGAGGGSGEGGEAGGGSYAGKVANELQIGRALILTGHVELQVDDFEATREKLATLTREHGGFVAGSSRTTHRRDNQTWTTGTLVLRVPNERFYEVFGAVKAAGRVEFAESDTEDVTDQLVDIQARLANLRAQRDRLRALYERANETEDILRVGKRLSEVQGRIERLEAHQRELKNSVALSTITVEFAEPEPELEAQTPTPGVAYHETGLGKAFFASVNGVVVTLRTVAVTLAYLMPYLVVFGLPLVGLAAVTRRRGLW